MTLERNTVLFRDPSNAGRRFVPLLLADCKLPDTLRRYRYVDFREETDAAFDELLAACRSETEVASVGPQSPKPRDSREAAAVLEREIKGHVDWVRTIAVSPDGQWAVSGSDDGSIKMWDLITGKRRVRFKGFRGSVSSAVITGNGKYVVGSSNSSVRVWDASSGAVIRHTLLKDSLVLSVSAEPTGKSVLFVGASDGHDVQLWNWEHESTSWSYRAAYAHSCAIAPDGTYAVVGKNNGEIDQIDMRNGQRIATLVGHSSRVVSVQITPDSRLLISGSDDKTIKIWHPETATCMGMLEGHLGETVSVAISSDVVLVASAGFTDRTVRLWEWKSGACVEILEYKDTFPLAVAFSPDGMRLVVGAANGSVYVYRLTGGRAAPFAQPPRRYVNAKVVLLGEGTAGKTSLAHRLIEDRYVVKDRTHGMNVWPLELPLPPDAAIDREALLWDLAGQEDSRLIHRLFLNDTALALLLLNPQKDDPFAEAGDWLKALETAASQDQAKYEAARLLIFSQVDVGGMKLGNAKIERFVQEHGFATWLDTSAKTGKNCSDGANDGKPSKLKQLIAEHIPWETLPWTATPRMLAELKNAVMTMRSTTDIRLLRFAELAQRLEQALPGEQFGDADVRTAVTLLANHGLARPLKFGDLVLLQPELLNGYAGAIIRSARAHRDEIGCVLEADIYRPDFDFTGVDRLPRPDEELLLRALVQTFLDHSLCIAEETPHGRQLVFPSQYRREKDIPWEPGVFVSYTFGGEWQTVWTTLVVRLWYSQEFRHKELWRNAAEFSSTRGHLLGLKIDNRQGEGEATISLFFDLETPDDLKVIFIEYVHRHLARYGCNVTRDRRYVCVPCGTRQDVAAVRRRFADEKKFITCQTCDERVPLIDYIEQHLESDPVARKILAMEEEATRQLDTQALEQILTGHVQAITGEANQIFRTLTQFDYGIDGEIEFKDNDGRASGKKVYVQLKSGNSYLRTRKSDGREVFDVKDDRHLHYWISQPVDVYLVIRQTDEKTGSQTIRWMNVTRYLKNRKDKENRQILFEGDDLTMETVWKLRDRYFPPRRATA